MIIKIIASLFAFFAWSRVYKKYTSRKASLGQLLVWTFIWIGIIAVVMAPNLTNPLAHLIGMGRGFDALVFASMLAVFFAIYRITSKLKQIESDITQLVRELSLSGNNQSSKDSTVLPFDSNRSSLK